MKKLSTLLGLTILTFLFLFSCSSDDNDDSTSSNEIAQKLVGKWYFTDPSTNPEINNSFTFTSNGKVTYSYWSGGSGNNYDSETGTFSVKGDVLTMIFPDDVEAVFVQKVTFINDNTVKFVYAENSDEEPYAGTYYKAK